MSIFREREMVMGSDLTGVNKDAQGVFIIGIRYAVSDAQGGSSEGV